MAKPHHPPTPSPLTNLLASSSAESPITALPFEILHNLQHQHSWTDLKLHLITTFPSSSQPKILDVSLSGSKLPESISDSQYLISGLPPRHAYIHPDFQSHLLRHSIPVTTIAIQREYVLPLSLAQKYSLRRLATIFDALPTREAMQDLDGKVLSIASKRGKQNIEEGEEEIEGWKDAKRLLMGMVAANGMGGDGTVVYYIVQEGDVKPRQNG